MKRLLDLVNEYKFLIYFCLIVIANSLWFIDYLGIWFLTFGIILTMPILGLDFILALALVIEDGIFKLVSFYFEPKLLTYYPFYFLSALASLALLSYILGRIKKERYDLLTTLHRLKNESDDLEASTPILNNLAREDTKKVSVGNLIREREESYKNILRIVKQNFHPYSAFLYFYRTSDNSFYVREFISESENVNTGNVYEKEGILHAVSRERRIINVRKIQNSQHFTPYYYKKEDVRSLIALPLLSGKRLKGILCLDSLQPDRFTSADEEILKGLCKEIVKVIDSSETMRGLERIREELQNISELGTRLNRHLTQTEIVDVLIDISKKFVNFDFSCFVAFDSEKGKNTIVRIYSEEEKNYEGRDFACDDKLGLTSWVIRNNVPLEYCQIKGKRKEIILFNRNFKIPFRYNSVLILPLKSQNTVLGAFIMASNRGTICREDDKKILEGICSQIGIALENCRMYEALRHLATIDGLTGLSNHRVFQESLTGEIQRHERHPDNFSLLFIDIDYFKSFNDRYGHPIGDFVLKEISSILQSMVRKADVAARYGGEEFAIILINTDHSGAIKLGERIRQKVASSTFTKNDLNLHVTLSIGVATYPNNASTKQDLIESADRALYLAKANGRNRVVHFNAIDKQRAQYKNLESGPSPTSRVMN